MKRRHQNDTKHGIAIGYEPIRFKDQVTSTNLGPVNSEGRNLGISR
jgi:hypothetical protein